jgi:DNA repair exonuclease SbcCD ATPase subunit
MNEVIRSMELSGNLSEEQNEALNLHYEIIAKGNLAASAMVDFCQNLKRMRDERKYLLLGHETFEEYVEQDVGIKQRQAYTYIQALESLGEKYLQSNASLGISKLGMLAALPWYERKEVEENNDVAEMSTRELKETISKLHEAQEQLTLITAERDELAKSSQEHEDLSDTVRRLREELKAASEKPAATVMREPTAEEIKQYTVDAIEKERAKAKKDREKAIAEAEKRVRDAAEKSAADELGRKTEELEKKYKAVLDAAEKEKSELTGRLEKVEKDAKLTASPEVAKFSVYFDSVQKYINVMRDIIASMDDETTAAKLRDAMQKLGALLQEG